jgi:hypothetical protein
MGFRWCGLRASLAHAHRDFPSRSHGPFAAGSKRLAGTVSQKHAWRAAIILLSADGVGTNDIIRRSGVPAIRRRHKARSTAPAAPCTSARWPRCTLTADGGAGARSSSSRSAWPPPPRRDPPARGPSGQPEAAVGGARPTTVGHAVANLKAAHAIAELIDFPDDIMTQHERRPAGGSFTTDGEMCASMPSLYRRPRRATVDPSPQLVAVRHRGPLRILLPTDLSAIGGWICHDFHQVGPGLWPHF